MARVVQGRVAVVTVCWDVLTVSGACVLSTAGVYHAKMNGRGLYYDGFLVYVFSGHVCCFCCALVSTDNQIVNRSHYFVFTRWW